MNTTIKNHVIMNGVYLRYNTENYVSYCSSYSYFLAEFILITTIVATWLSVIHINISYK